MTRNSLERELAGIKLLKAHVKSASGVATAVVTAFPMSGFVSRSLMPVWSGAPLLALFLSFLAMSFTFLASRGASSNVLFRRARHLTVGGGAILAVYFCLNWLCIFEYRGARIVTGLWPTVEAHRRVANGEADSLRRLDLLASFGFQSAEIAWNDVRFIDIAINLTFCVGCLALATGFFQFVLRNIALDTESAQKKGNKSDAT